MAPTRIVIAGLLLIASCSGCANRRPYSGSNDLERPPETLRAKGQPSVSSDKPEKKRVPKDQTNAITLPAFEVRESAFCDFGVSVKTNVEVKWGGAIEWMQVSGVEPGSLAAARNLRVGDQVLAIDKRPVTELDRDSMLEVLFQREKGDRSQLLILAVGEALPRFVTLVSNGRENETAP